MDEKEDKMSEKKFRAWDKENKYWIEDIQDEYDGQEPAFGYYLNNERYEVMQYTEIEDKNKKEAYTGDIYKDAVGNVRVIEWDYVLLARLQEIEFEIIGNIYESKHLLDNNSVK